MTVRNCILQGAALALLAGACDLVNSGGGSRSLTRADACGSATVELIAGQNIDIGSVTVYSDDMTICVGFATEGSWYLTETHVAIATDPAGIPQKQGNPSPGQFPYKHTGLWTQTDGFCVPLADVGAAPGDPLYIATHAAVAQEGAGGAIVARETAWGAGPNFSGSNWGMYFEYVPPSCEEEEDEGEDRVCGLRTQTQGGWGTSCMGENPGCYRDAHFGAAFPGGLVVGCGDLSATLLSSAAVERALPTGGTSRALLPAEAVSYDGSAADPTVQTVLFGQVVALALSVAFDANDDFKKFAGPVPLGELVLADPASPCVGMTIAAVLAEANLALGGCASQLPAGALSDCAAMVNEAFVDGEDDGEAVCSDRFAVSG